MRKILILSILIAILASCNQQKNDMKNENRTVTESTEQQVVKKLTDSLPSANRLRIERGVEQVAQLWRTTDGSERDFEKFCKTYFVADTLALHTLFSKLQHNLEIISGRLHQIDVELKEPVQLSGNEVTPIDLLFSEYDITAHIDEDFYQNKIALITALNFPFYSLKEKSELGEKWSRNDWAYARMGDRFISRVPANVVQNYSQTVAKADNYISNYNIVMGNVIDNEGKQLFAKDMKLISHWGLRDEIKSNYSDSINGKHKQDIVYQIMKRVIDQSIPNEVINNDLNIWNPFDNTVFENGKSIKATPENSVRYQTLLNNFLAAKEFDKYSPHYPTAIARNFDQTMEIPLKDVKKLFSELLSSQQVKDVAKMIKSRLKRDLQPYDIWYDGFKSRGEISEDELTKLTSAKYPTSKDFEKELPKILRKLGWDKKEADRISSLVQVDPSTGAGHAWGAILKGDKSRLRTRVGANGMDYKGYNIAVHEFGHNVEQTITLNDVDNWVLNGVPNNAFTEAAAFLFQKRDLELLGYKSNNKNENANLALDTFWSCYEIMGVALVDIATWEWMYSNPNATADQLKTAVIAIAKEIWNQYYADVLGGKDETILAIYSHMIDYPLYLSYYPIGHLISFQLDAQMKNKNMAKEMSRIFTQGRIIPQIWMEGAVGEHISTKPLLNAVDSAIEQLQAEK